MAGFDFGITSTLNVAPLVALIASLPLKSKAAVDEAAANIQELGAQLAPKATGALAASIYKNNGQNSDYSLHAGEAESRNPFALILDEIRPEFVISMFSAGGTDNAYISVIAPAVNYAIFNELGTVHMAPRPFMTPAAEITRTKFINDMSGVASV